MKKEFFQLIVKNIFDISYGMFTYNQETRTFWFALESYESNLKFELIGFILGLAMYNHVILDVHFPRIIYKKLLNQPFEFQDLKDYSPTIFNSFKFIEDSEDSSIIESLSIPFSVEAEVLGVKKVYELKENGSNIMLTLENKNEYINLYLDWLFNDSVKIPFSYFKKGFDKIVPGELIKDFEPDELELMICGSQILDFKLLEKNTKYDGGYNKDDQTIKYFWSVIHEMNIEQQKKFLAFATGSDRAPVNGLGSMEFYISKHGEDSEKLPCSHTCFNHLLLPAYKTREKLKDRLLLAINNCEGFGLI